jgi:lipid II:glycine glycyltransferase (peptidoglycan interpeptide bridge formation enzyme)
MIKNFEVINFVKSDEALIQSLLLLIKKITPFWTFIFLPEQHYAIYTRYYTILK